MKPFDVWAYYNMGRGLVYFATPEGQYADDGGLNSMPEKAEMHIAVVYANNKREAIHKAAKLNRDWSR